MRTVIDEVNNKFKYVTLMNDLWSQHEKFEEIINDKKRGFSSFSDDDYRVHNLFHELLDELKSQKVKLYFNVISCPVFTSSSVLMKKNLPNLNSLQLGVSE